MNTAASEAPQTGPISLFRKEGGLDILLIQVIKRTELEYIFGLCDMGNSCCMRKALVNVLIDVSKS